jgi:hypothetical protein
MDPAVELKKLWSPRASSAIKSRLSGSTWNIGTRRRKATTDRRKIDITGGPFTVGRTSPVVAALRVLKVSNSRVISVLRTVEVVKTRNQFDCVRKIIPR